MRDNGKLVHDLRKETRRLRAYIFDLMDAGGSLYQSAILGDGELTEEHEAWDEVVNEATIYIIEGERGKGD